MTPMRHPDPTSPDADELAAFRSLLARPESRAPDLDAETVDRLEGLGLLRRHEDGSLVALPPYRPLIAEAHRVQARADALREAAEALHAEFRRRPGAGREALDVVVGGAEIVEAAVEVARAARHTVRGFDRGPYFHTEALPDAAQSRSSDRGVHWRVVYEADTLRTEPPERWAALGSTPGETGRVMPHLPFKLLIADDTVALLGLAGPTAGSGEGLVVRGALLVDALVRLFEQQWELALPISAADGVGVGAASGGVGAGVVGGAGAPAGAGVVGGAGSSNVAGVGASAGVLDEVERRLLVMLSAGMTDEGMARSLATSRRTVQRRVAELARRMGAEGRFQLGVQAARRGWV